MPSVKFLQNVGLGYKMHVLQYYTSQVAFVQHTLSGSRSCELSLPGQLDTYIVIYKYCHILLPGISPTWPCSEGVLGMSID